MPSPLTLRHRVSRTLHRSPIGRLDELSRRRLQTAAYATRVLATLECVAPERWTLRSLPSDASGVSLCDQLEDYAPYAPTAAHTHVLIDWAIAEHECDVATSLERLHLDAAHFGVVRARADDVAAPTSMPAEMIVFPRSIDEGEMLRLEFI